MNTTIVKTALGKTIMIQHDVSSIIRIQEYIFFRVQKERYANIPSEHIAMGEEWANEAKMKELYDKYSPEIVKRVGEMAKKVGGHGGMDFIMDWRLMDCLRNGLPLDQNVYDGALWSSVAPLSEWSVANRSQSIDVPDFTGGSWKTNKPHGINLETGGNTKVLEIAEVKEKM